MHFCNPPSNCIALLSSHIKALKEKERDRERGGRLSEKKKREAVSEQVSIERCIYKCR